LEGDATGLEVHNSE